MPSLDQGEFLEAALRSVLLQDGPEVELIVVDGGSRDGSVEVLEKYDPWLSRWTSEPDRGQAHAINKGLARATGDVLGWLNSDDLLLPGALDRIATAFARRSDLSVVCGFRKVLDAGGAFVRNWVRDLPTAHYLRHYCCVAQETVYWRRQVLERLGPLDESFHYALDYDYWLRMLAAGYELTPLPAYLGAAPRATRTRGSSTSALPVSLSKTTKCPHPRPSPTRPHPTGRGAPPPAPGQFCRCWYRARCVRFPPLPGDGSGWERGRG
jgi:glycosyltransferase involved in cell wall biosynthesis